MWGVLAGTTGLIFLLTLGIAGYFLMYCRDPQSSPPPELQIVIVIVIPTEPIRVSTEALTQPVASPMPTDTSPPPPTQVIETQYCNMFDGMDISVVFRRAVDVLCQDAGWCSNPGESDFRCI